MSIPKDVRPGRKAGDPRFAILEQLHACQEILSLEEGSRDTLLQNNLKNMRFLSMADERVTLEQLRGATGSCASNRGRTIESAATLLFVDV